MLHHGVQNPRTIWSRSTASATMNPHVPSSAAASRDSLRTVSLSALSRSSTCLSATPVGFVHCTSTQPGYLPLLAKNAPTPAKSVTLRSILAFIRATASSWNHYWVFLSRWVHPPHKYTRPTTATHPSPTPHQTQRAGRQT